MSNTYPTKSDHFQGLVHMKATQLSGGAVCVQTSNVGGAEYYESHSTDQSGCTNRSSFRFGVALDNWNRTAFLCRDGSMPPTRTCGLFSRIFCDGDSVIEVSSSRIILRTRPVDAFVLTTIIEPYEDAELSTAALSGITVGCVAGVGLVAGGVYAMKKKQSSEGVRRPLV